MKPGNPSERRFAVNEIELASLVASRVCHDVINPVGAISNGIEILESESDASMREHAIALIANSAKQASAKLKLCRLAYGSMGSAGDHFSLGEARDALEGYLRDSKTRLDWRAPAMIVPKDTAKLALNLAMAALETIPRGGVLTVTAEETALGLTLMASAEGPSPRLNEDVRSALTGEVPFGELNGRYVQPYLTGLIARSLGTAIGLRENAGGFSLSAEVPRRDPAAAAA
jgi:histidine phosphotransferase ChpT